MPKFSIITVCKNTEQTIERTIRSVLEQNFKDYEYIIVDGASADKTLEITKKYKRQINKMISEPDAGIYDAMNKGIKAAAGEYLLFLNAGDFLLHENVLTVANAGIMQNPVDIFYGNILVLDEHKGSAWIHQIGQVNKKKMFTNTIPHPSAFMARECFTKVGFYDTRWRICADYAWFLKAILKTKCAHQYFDFAVSVFRLGGISSNPEYTSAQLSERELIQAQYYNFIERRFYVKNYIMKKVISLF
jgi:glycosyltransferase involved in cell wall biosynthesis